MTQDDAIELIRELLVNGAHEVEVAKLRDFLSNTPLRAKGSILWHAVSQAHEYMNEPSPP
jgi:hypothetical protein